LKVQLVIYFSHYPDEVALLDVLISNESLFEIFKEAFFLIRTNQKESTKDQSVENIGFLILQGFITKKIGKNQLTEISILLC
jgi:hypothetical protein